MGCEKKKRSNECLFCTSRKCYTHVYSYRDAGKSYNEIACDHHQTDLYTNADMSLPGVQKVHIVSSEPQSRRDTSCSPRC